MKIFEMVSNVAIVKKKELCATGHMGFFSGKVNPDIDEP